MKPGSVDVGFASHRGATSALDKALANAAVMRNVEEAAAATGRAGEARGTLTREGMSVAGTGSVVEAEGALVSVMGAEAVSVSAMAIAALELGRMSRPRRSGSLGAVRPALTGT